MFSQFSWSLYHHTARKYNQHSGFTSLCLGVSIIFNIFHQYIHPARAAFTGPWLYSFQLMFIDFLCLSHPSFIALHVFFWCWPLLWHGSPGCETQQRHFVCVSRSCWDNVQSCPEQLWFCAAIKQWLFWGYWCLFCRNTWDVLIFFKIDFVLPGRVSVPGTFLSPVFVKLSELKYCCATRGSFPDINIETKMNCLTLSEVSMWWRERGWRGKAINNNKKRLPNTETEISTWKFVTVFPGEPQVGRSREGRGRRQNQWQVVWESLVNESSLRSLDLSEQAIGGEGKLGLRVLLYWKIQWHTQDIDFFIKILPFQRGFVYCRECSRYPGPSEVIGKNVLKMQIVAFAAA